MRTAPDPPGYPDFEEVLSPGETAACSQDIMRGIDPPSDPSSSIANLKPPMISNHSETPINSLGTPEVEPGDRAVVPYEPLPPPESTHQESSITHGPLDVALSRELVISQPKPQKSHPETDKHVPVVPMSRELVVSQPKTKPSPARAPADMRTGGFDHCYVTVPCKDRLSVLFATLRRSSERKVIVLCATWESAAFHTVLFRQLEGDVGHVHELNEHLKDVARAYDDFAYLYPGILFASEIAMREFDIPPNVDYFIQYEQPMNPTEYIYQMSNASIYRTSCHKALLFLSPEEKSFLKYFDHIENKELEARKVSEFQDRVEKLVLKHSKLNDMARKAFRSFLVSYESHVYRDVYDPANIDREQIRKAFGHPDAAKEVAKTGLAGEKKEATKGEKESGDQPAKTNHWTSKEKTWRKGSNTWTTREDKSWKYGHRL